MRKVSYQHNYPPLVLTPQLGPASKQKSVVVPMRSVLSPLTSSPLSLSLYSLSVNFITVADEGSVTPLSAAYISHLRCFPDPTPISSL